MFRRVKNKWYRRCLSANVARAGSLQHDLAEIGDDDDIYQIEASAIRRKLWLLENERRVLSMKIENTQ